MMTSGHSLGLSRVRAVNKLNAARRSDSVFKGVHYDADNALGHAE